MIWENHKKYLQFLWKDSLLEFACLPFGLAVAPRVFTKILKPVVALLRRTGIRLIIYLDELLFMNSSKSQMSSTGHDHSSVLARESGLRNKPREILLSTDTTVGVSRVRCEYSGYDSAPARLQGGGDQIPLFQDIIASRSFSTGALSAHRQTNCVYSSYFPSSLALSAPAESETQSLSPIRPFRCYDRSVHGGQGRTSVVARAFECLEWEGSSPPFFRCDNRNRRLSHRLGAVCQGVTTGGLWSQMEKKLHINCLELLAGSFAVKSFTKDRLCVHVRLRMDNVSAVAYINRLGGTHSLIPSNLALALWEWALKRNIFLSAEHLSGALNVSADW